MKNIKNWLTKKGYEFKVETWGNNGNTVQCIMVENNYNGLYPAQKEIDNLNIIKAYINKHHKNFKVEGVGNLTGILISPK